MKDLCTYAPGHTSPATVPVPLNLKSRKAFSRRRTNILVILLSVSLLLLSQFSTAQAPQQFSFQGVARGADGKILASKSIMVGFGIHQGSANGPVVFSETHNTITNANGIFNLQIGSITNLGDIDWGMNFHFLQAVIYYDGLPAFVDLGTTQLLSVPYSLLASKSLSAKTSTKADTALVSKKWIDNEPIVQTGESGAGSLLPDVAVGNTLIWYPKKGAFRAGRNNGNWDRANMGEFSFAAGNGTLASGESSASFGAGAKATGGTSFAAGAIAEATGSGAIAMGANSIASGEFSISLGSNSAQAAGDYSVALGISAEASGSGSMALGNSTAVGNYSFSLGEGVEVKAVHGIAIGRLNNIGDSPGISPAATDRIFQLGNGTTNALRSNAITVLRNGNIGIGNNVLTPEYIMDFGGRPRIRHNSGSTAGLFFNDSQNTPEGFVGMVNDNEIGFYIGDAWRFVVNKSGTVYADQFFTTSDKSLKSDITPIKNSLVNLTELSGYNYRWKSKNSDNGLQTGLLAQEVEIYFPNLVTTKKDGFKAVNYIGLIPHLIEAIKELDKKTEEISALKKELASVQEMNKKLSALEANVKELLAGQAGTSTQTGK